MARQWRKLHSKLIHSKNLNMAAYDNPLAERLFFRMIAACDDYGRLPADAWKLKSQTAPMLPEDLEQIAGAIQTLKEHNLIDLYEVDEEPYLFLENWFEYQDLKWFAVGKPEYPHPPDWRPPNDLLEWVYRHSIDTSADNSSKYAPSRYGLDRDTVMAHLNGSSIDVSAEASADKTVDISGEGTDTDVDVDTDKGKGNNLMSDESEDSPSPTDDLQTQLSKLHSGTPSQDLTLIDEFLDLCAAENKSGKITLGRRVNETRDLLELRDQLGIEPWRFGMAAACRNEASHLNYVKKAAGSWNKQRASPQRGPAPPDDFSDVKTNEYGEVID